MKYLRNNFDYLFDVISSTVKTKVIPVGSYGRFSDYCGDLDVLIEVTDEYSGSNVFKDLLNNNFRMTRFKENDGGEIWLDDQMCHVIFYNKKDFILKLVRFMSGKNNVFMLFHEIYKAGYRVDANQYKIYNRQTNEEILIKTLDDLESIIGFKVPYHDIITSIITKYLE